MFVGVGGSTLEEGGEALEHPRFQTWNPVVSLRAMNAKYVTPILNVFDMAASPLTHLRTQTARFAWFAKWGWGRLWDWGTPPTFRAVGQARLTKGKADPSPRSQSARAGSG